MRWQVISVVLLTTTISSLGQAQTPPADYTPVEVAAYLRGWQDAKNLPTTAPTYVPDGSDLATVLASAKAGTTIDCVPLGHYYINSTVALSPSQRGITLNGNGSNLECSPTAGASSNIRVGAAHFTLRGFDVTKATVFTLVFASDCTIADCNFVGVQTAAQTDAGGVNLSFVNNHVVQTSKVSVYINESNSLIDRCAFDGSAGEYCVRYDLAASGRKLTGAVLSNSNLTNHNSGHKQAIGVRYGDSVRLINLRIDGAVRWGNVPGTGAPPITSPTQCNAGAVMQGCTFLNSDVGQNAVQVLQGSTINIVGLAFQEPVNVIGPPISIDVNSIATVVGNVQQIYPGETAKRIVAISSQGQYTMSGNTVQIVQKP